MKKQVLILLFVIAGFSSYAQCDKKSILTSSSTEYLTSSGEIRKTKEETTTIEFDSKTIVIAPGDHVMEGTVTSITSCDWKTAYKEGKTVLKATMDAGEGQTLDVVITIEGKDGKVILMFEESPEKRIRVTADKFEEKK